MKRRSLIKGSAAGLFSAVAGTPLLSRAQSSQPFRIGFIQPMTGAFASTGRQQEAAARLYLAQIGGSIAGRKIELMLKDDGGAPDVTRRIASELVVNDKVNVLAGFGLTPLALAAAPIATQSRTPMVVTAAATSSITDASPFIVRTSYTLPQSAQTLAVWAVRSGMKRFVSLVTDYGPGYDAEKYFNDYVKRNGGEVLDAVRVPLRDSDYSPYLQKVRDLKPEAVFVFLPSGPGAIFMKQFAERGLDKAGIRIIGDGGLTDDDLLNDIGDVAVGVITSQNYSAAHPSDVNRKFVKAFMDANKGMRPNFMAVGAYDGMHVICDALKATNGTGDGPALLAAMRGQSFESPRGPFQIDPATRDVIHDIYLRKVERVDGQLWNIEFDAVKAVKDPGKSTT